MLLSMAEVFCSILSSKEVLSAGQQGASLRSEAVESFPVFFFQSISISRDKTRNKILSVRTFSKRTHAVTFSNYIQLSHVSSSRCVYN